MNGIPPALIPSGWDRKDAHPVTRELKLALIVGFSLVLVVTVLLSDHLSRARTSVLEPQVSPMPALTPEAPREVVDEPEPERTELALHQPTESSFALDETEASPHANPPAPVELIMGNTRRVESGTPNPDLAAVTDALRLLGGTIEGGTVHLPPAVVLSGNSRDPLPGGGAESITPENRGLRPVSSAAPAIAPPATGRTYTVVSGDSVYKLAKREYGSGEMWRRLVEFNQGGIPADGSLRIGMKIKLPTPEEVASATLRPGTHAKASETMIKDAERSLPPRPTTTGRQRTYIIRKGDTLGTIASRELGSAKRAREILDLNRGTLKSPDIVPLGATIKLPNS